MHTFFFDGRLSTRALALAVRALAWVAIGTMGCDSTTTPPDLSGLGLGYFPLAQGQYRDYQVEEINYALLGDIDTLGYYIREQVGEPFINLAGDTSYAINRFRREQPGEAWQPLSVWTARRNNFQAVLVEENNPLVKLSFPLAEGRRWDGNALNNGERDDYEITNGAGAFEIPGVGPVADALTVLQNNNNDFVVSLDKREEIYGLGIGLMYREAIFLKFCTTEECLIDPDTIINTGSVFRQSLIGYGKE